MQWFRVSATTTMFYESLEALGQGLLKLVVNQPMNRDILLVGGGGGQKKIEQWQQLCVNKFLVFSAGNGFKIVV